MALSKLKFPGALLKSLVQMAIFALIVGWILSHTAKPDPSQPPAGFFTGMLHGAIMPTTFPNLVAGFNVNIYAENNTGMPYKLGYVCGVNVMGFIFFGFLFWQWQKWRDARRSK